MSAVEFVPKSTIIGQSIDRHRVWIEAQLGAVLSDCLQLRFEFVISSAATAHMLPEITFAFDESKSQSSMRRLLRTVTFPPETLPALSLSLVRDPSASFAARSRVCLPEWLDCPISMQLEGLPGPIIVMNIPYIDGAQSQGSWREVVVVRRDYAEQLITLVQAVSGGDADPGVLTYGQGFRKIRPVSWENLVLDANIARLLRHDYENFFRREAWFKANHLPFRRGYLLHGPPGNGKTSAVCAMLSRPGVTGHTLNLSLEQVADNDLSGLFDHAAMQAPSIVLFEDLDRFFNHSHKEKQQTKVSLQHLLNCLDGAATQDGIVVVATANHPKGLDLAILRRPGRFDRVVAFTPPDLALRTEFFQRLNTTFAPDKVALCGQASSGLSFAQLKESYVLGAQHAFEEDRQIAAEDILTAISMLRSSLQSTDAKSEGVSGFRCG